MTIDPLTTYFPSAGWKQIHQRRGAMLAQYEKAKVDEEVHGIETHHGVVAEGCVREWLNDFLPAAFGVTSGRIVSPGLGPDEPLPHFDVIIYDRLKSPVLWTDDIPERSELGIVRAIPVEHAMCVLEVKSRFNRESLDRAIDQMTRLRRLMAEAEAPEARYRRYLSPDFFFGFVFFEIRAKDAKPSLLDRLKRLAAFERVSMGALILTSEGAIDSQAALARCSTTNEEWPPLSPDRNLLDRMYHVGESTTVGQHTFAGCLNWGASTFAEFAFELLARLQGTYEHGLISSLYGVGDPDNPVSG